MGSQIEEEDDDCITISNYGKFERQGSESNDAPLSRSGTLRVSDPHLYPPQRTGSGHLRVFRHNRFVCFETAPTFYVAASERIRAARDET